MINISCKYTSMFSSLSLLFSLLLIQNGICGADDLNKKRFPKDFIFAFASSAYQVEGAWNEDGKGEHIWDRFVHSVPSPIRNNATADVACDSYHKYKEDIALLKETGATHFRFSIMWTRILPTGFSNKVNQAGIDYYKRFIKELKDNNIEPIVTLHHSDTPQRLEEMGGFLNEYNIDRFVEYARICFENFGDDVKIWITFNEPVNVCLTCYGSNKFPPANIVLPGIGNYLCGHTLLKAHAKVYRLYDKEFRPKQKGKIGLALGSSWSEPDTDTDIEAAYRYQQFRLGWMAHPVFKGDYPEVLKKFIDRRSKIQGFAASRLPKFSKEEVEYINGTFDFFGLNYYTTSMIKQKTDPEYNRVSYGTDSETTEFSKPEWIHTTGQWIYNVPWGIRKLLNWIRDNYGDVPILITENGFDDANLIDDNRIEYIREHLSNVRSAMDDGVNVIGYTYWSFLDTFGWIRGYSDKFGIYHVDFNSPNRTRTARKSVGFVKHVYTTRCIVEESECYE